MASDEPLKNVTENCMDCFIMQMKLDETKTAGITFDGQCFGIDYLRGTCMRCKKGSKGIYKYDAIRTALDLQAENQRLKKALNKGKKPTALKRYGTTVKNLKEEGKSIRQIAEIVGIAPNTVVKILKEQDAQKSDK